MLLAGAVRIMLDDMSVTKAQKVEMLLDDTQKEDEVDVKAIHYILKWD